MKKRIIAFVLATVLLASLSCLAYADEDWTLMSTSSTHALEENGITKSQLLGSSYGRAELSVMMIADLFEAGFDSDDISIDPSYLWKSDSSNSVFLLIGGSGTYSGKTIMIAYSFDEMGGYYIVDDTLDTMAEALSQVDGEYWKNNWSDIESVVQTLLED